MNGDDKFYMENEEIIINGFIKAAPYKIAFNMIFKTGL